MQQKKLRYIFFSSAFYGQRSVTAALATRSPLSICIQMIILSKLNSTIRKFIVDKIFQGLRVAKAAVTELWPLENQFFRKKIKIT